MPATPPTAQLGPLAALVGTWHGSGSGRWGDASFEYTEELTFVAGAKPQLAYRQRTRAADDGRALHAEDGFWRLAGEDVELVLAHGIGIAEVSTGRWDGGTLVARATVLQGAPTAKTVTGVERTYAVDGDTLRCTLRMATDGGALRPHLEATLRRVGDPR